MKPERELTKDILLSYHNVHGKNTRIHETVKFYANERVVVKESNCIKLRFFKWLPPKVTEHERRIPVPGEITTETQLRQFLGKQGIRVDAPW